MPDIAQQMVGLSLVVAGVFAVLYAILGWERGLRVKWFLADAFVDGDWTMPVRRLVEFREVARLAFDGMQAQGATATGGSERAFAPAKGRITALLGTDYDRIPVYGRRYEAGKLERIAAGYLSCLHFTDDLNGYLDKCSDCGRYAEVYIGAIDAGRRLNRMERAPRHGLPRRPLPNA